MKSDLRFGIFDHMDRGRTAVDQFYADRLELVRQYDKLGFYSYHLAEHHGTPLGIAPSPGIFLSAVAAHTRRLRFGPLVYLLPLYHPIRLAEEIVMLDQLSKGRLDCGIGRGASPLEAMLFGADHSVAEEIFIETVEILKQAFTRQQVDFEGKHLRFHDIFFEVAPYQKPYPPFWYGINTATSAEKCVERGFNAITLPRTEIVNEVARRFHAATEAAGNDLTLGLLRFVVVGETTEEALKVGRRAFLVWRESLHFLYHKYGRSPVHGDRPDFDGMIELGQAVAGTPAEVAATIRKQIGQTGVTYYVAQPMFGDMTREEALRSVDLYAREVIPAVRLPFAQAAST
jgi:alkanesulfonate monooxygenase SsuD/methylene tetrahydromethanopterin reductase-like flavin-dependent oxidoreductase (luciferase family)